MASRKPTHEPTIPLFVTRTNRKQGGRTGGRKWNVWYVHLKCPLCGRDFVVLQNTSRGRKLRCVGRDSLQITKKDPS